MLRPASATKSDPTEAWVLVLVPVKSFFRLPLGTIPEYYASPLNPGNVSEAKAVWTSDSSNEVVRAEARALANKSRREKNEEGNRGPGAGVGCVVGDLADARARLERSAAAGAQRIASSPFAVE